MQETEPIDHELPGHNWSLKKLKQWLKQTAQPQASRSTLRLLLKGQGLSWKKCQKVLKKAKPDQRADFIQRFNILYEALCREELLLLYLDEAHFHRDMDLGYTWVALETHF